MQANNILSKTLLWLPSIIITLYYIPNALDKLINHDQIGKIVESSAVMIFAGIFILTATALFLYKKTMVIGTAMLALYMIPIILIHMYKSKPAEIIILILIATVFATYVRQSQLLHQNIK